MANDSNEALSLFEVPPAGPAGNGDYSGDWDDHTTAPADQGNPLALAGAVVSFLPPVGLALSAIGLRRSRSRRGAGRTAALIGITLSLVLGGVETYIAATAPILDSGCLNANTAASRLRAVQAAPGGDLSALAAELDVIHTSLDGAADSADSAQVRTRLQLVAGDLEALSVDITNAKATGETAQLVTDEAKLQVDGTAADSYCHSL